MDPTKPIERREEKETTHSAPLSQMKVSEFLPGWTIDETPIMAIGGTRTSGNPHMNPVVTRKTLVEEMGEVKPQE
jgi:hypothetical protein